MAAAAEYTIDELAQAAGTTVRSVRVYHERGVLQPPQVRGRTGYYSAEHLNRVRTISRLLDRGIKLNGIKELLAAWDRGDDLGAVLGVEEPEPPSTHTSNGATISATELQQRFADIPSGFARVVAAGIFEPVDATTYHVADPVMAGLLDRITALGVPCDEALHEIERLKSDCDRIARRFVELLRRNAWEPFAASAGGSQDLAQLATQVAALREIPGQAAGELVKRLIERRIDEDEDLAEVLNNS
ncbi:MerR family transcriptional regulator [Nocardia tengchongensis]|uniref:MerR family transcriptional regulator n=1 Tax=Nocardia tengchongensis TaxID=2055889 RepID=UPI0036145331